MQDSLEHELGSLAQDLVEQLTQHGQTLATAESLTGGLVASEIVAIAGASEVLAGGIVAYSAAAKIAVLAVDAELIAERGTVCDQVAVQMAEATRRKFDSTYGVATTGVAGPGDHEGKPAGRTHIAVVSSDGRQHYAQFDFTGDRHAVRQQAALQALQMLSQLLHGE